MAQSMHSDDVEATLFKIWDLHDKLSDTIHSISRAHFTKKQQCHSHKQRATKSDVEGNGFVYCKETSNGTTMMLELGSAVAVAEARSLDGIRSALEVLEEQLEFFHTVQIQQRAERDAALARLEQSRIILALRLSEHHGKRYKVIDEALDFVGDVQDGPCFITPEDLSGPSLSATFGLCQERAETGHNGWCLRQCSAFFAISMLAMLHIHRVSDEDEYRLMINQKQDRSSRNNPQFDALNITMFLESFSVFSQQPAIPIV
ncbi:Plastid division protein PDV1-like protein [Drosera capensis]